MNTRNILRIILAIFLIRLAFAMFPSFQVDMGAWTGWAQRIVEVGTARFYSDEVWTQYTPGYLYYLLLIGKLGVIDPLFIKISAIIADLLVGIIIWKLIRRKSTRVANLAFVLYTLSPVAIIDGSIWGQIDGILTLFMIASSYYLIEKKNNDIAAMLWAIAFLIKPQAIAILPILIGLTWKRSGIWAVVRAGFIAGTITTLGYLPFYPQDPIGGMFELLGKMRDSYSYTSLFAFNVWSYVGMWIPDSIRSFGWTYQTWGTIMMGIVYIFLLIKLLKNQEQGGREYLLLGLGCMTFFLFPTRVHERYMFPAFAFLMVEAGRGGGRWKWILIIALMLVYSANLYLPYSYYETTTNILKNTSLEELIMKSGTLIATIQLAIFGLFVLAPGGEKAEESIPILSGKRVAIKHGKYKKE